MRQLPVRRLVISAACAALLLGGAAPLAAAENGAPGPARPNAAAPVAGTEALLHQATTLGDTGGVLGAISDLIEAVTGAAGGQLGTQEAQTHSDAVRHAIGDAQRGSESGPKSAGIQDAHTLPARYGADEAKSPRAAAPDPRGEALTTLQSRADRLIEAARGGSEKTVKERVAQLVQGQVDLMAATLAADGMPRTSLQGLPEAPSTDVHTLPDPTSARPDHRG
ncbi:hypothetical protein [Streptomyces sp. NPDC050560]|uniref:hypothetical protein n=1 Tax=Streptomyces sp. NPDC050560 TaxID=3365630 RepID=UPI003788E61A